MKDGVKWLNHQNKMAELVNKNYMEGNTFRPKSQTDEKNLINKAVQLHAKGNMLEAEKAYREAVRNGILNVAIFSNLGLLCQATQRIDEAILHYKKAIKISPNHPDPYTNLGSCYKDIGKLDKAITSTLKSLEINPDNPTALMNLGGMQKNLGNLDQALSATLKSLEHSPDNPTVLMNLGGIQKDLGNLDQALSTTLKSLKLNPDNHTAHMNLGIIYRELGNLNKAAICFKEATKSKELNETAATELAQTYYYMGQYSKGLKAIRNNHGKAAENIRLSMYLCLNEKNTFNNCANGLIRRGILNQQGIAAIDHANTLFSQSLENGLAGNTLDSVFTQRIHPHEFSDELMESIIAQLSTGSVQSRPQGNLAKGSQTSGNIFDIASKPYQSLKKLIVQKISEYNKSCDINTDKDFDDNWAKNLYSLKGWAIIMNKGGNLKPHNHETGWLTGTFYLQMPEEFDNPEEGAIEFSHQGPKYPTKNITFEKRLIRPSTRDLNIFSSSLFHKTLPFKSEKQRICIAFDISQNNNQ